MTDQDTAAHPLEAEIAAYHRLRPELEEHHKGKFVVIKGAELQGTFDTLDHAANFAREKLGRGPYLIRQVAVDYGPLPASVLYRGHEFAAISAILRYDGEMNDGRIKNRAYLA